MLFCLPIPEFVMSFGLRSVFLFNNCHGIIIILPALTSCTQISHRNSEQKEIRAHKKVTTHNSVHLTAEDHVMLILILDVSVGYVT